VEFGTPVSNGVVVVPSSARGVGVPQFVRG